jgi:cytochrome c2
MVKHIHYFFSINKIMKQHFRKWIIAIIWFYSFLPILLKAQESNTTNGKQLFHTYCTSCHAVDKIVVGPALKDVDKRHNEDWIIRFVHSSQSLIQSGDTAANRLFEQYNKTIMPDHLALKDEDIKNIIAYIKEETALLASKPSSPQPMSYNYNPYPGKSSIWHQIVYLDLKGNFFPLKPNNYLFWYALGGLILILIGALALLVKVTDMKQAMQKNKD